MDTVSCGKDLTLLESSQNFLGFFMEIGFNNRGRFISPVVCMVHLLPKGMILVVSPW